MIEDLEKMIDEAFDRERAEQESLIIKELEKAARRTCEEDS